MQTITKNSKVYQDLKSKAIGSQVTVDLDIGSTTVTVVNVLGSFTALLFLGPPDQIRKQKLVSINTLLLLIWL